MITEQDRYDFTSGGCFVLAYELSKATGWPKFCVTRKGANGFPGRRVHVVVQRPDGMYLDIEGWRSEQDLLDNWNASCLEPALFTIPDAFWRLPRRFNFKGGFAYLQDRARELIPELLGET